jgi:HNH endonuclease
VSGSWIPAALRAEVERRAQERCEYYKVPEGSGLWPHEADHIISEQHGGKTELANLAFACWHCNRYKGPNVASVDPHSGAVVPLFHPRIHSWNEHFEVCGAQILHKTRIGLATLILLRFNSPERLLVRLALKQAGRW